MISAGRRGALSRPARTCPPTAPQRQATVDQPPRRRTAKVLLCDHRSQNRQRRKNYQGESYPFAGQQPEPANPRELFPADPHLTQRPYRLMASRPRTGWQPDQHQASHRQDRSQNRERSPRPERGHDSASRHWRRDSQRRGRPANQRIRPSQPIGGHDFRQHGHARRPEEPVRAAVDRRHRHQQSKRSPADEENHREDRRDRQASTHGGGQHPPARKPITSEPARQRKEQPQGGPGGQDQPEPVH